MYRDSDDSFIGSGWYAASYLVIMATLGVAQAAYDSHAATSIMDPYGQMIAAGEVLAIVLALIGYVIGRRT